VLSPVLQEINYLGACLVAAHQYLYATEGKGYLNADNQPDIKNRDHFIHVGKALIEYLKVTTHA
jgi:hypothetical protein